MDHCGHEVHELYVMNRYKTFKAEILEYKHFGLITAIAAMKIITIKACYYLKTQTARAIKADKGRLIFDNPGHYGIDNESHLCADNLYSLILYTDYDALSSDFSSSFRKIYPFETLQNVKIRNSYYWWWSKTLRETVELYGSTGSKYAQNPRLNGPFFTGLSFVMNIPQYQIKLNSPTSTSTHIQVATKFAGDQGMIIELDIEDSDRTMDNLRGFDCSWISQYKGEDEMYVYYIHIFIFCQVLFTNNVQNNDVITYYIDYF